MTTHTETGTTNLDELQEIGISPIILVDKVEAILASIEAHEQKLDAAIPNQLKHEIQRSKRVLNTLEWLEEIRKGEKNNSGNGEKSAAQTSIENGKAMIEELERNKAVIDAPSANSNETVTLQEMDTFIDEVIQKLQELANIVENIALNPKFNAAWKELPEYESMKSIIYVLAKKKKPTTEREKRLMRYLKKYSNEEMENTFKNMAFSYDYKEEPLPPYMPGSGLKRVK